MSVTRVHAEYEAIFDDLVALIQDPESFDADLLEEEAFDTRFRALDEALKKVKPDYKQSKRRAEVLHQLIFVADESERWIIPDNYAAYITLWKRAMAHGFLPDCVCTTGPTPKTRWEEIPRTPTKTSGKRFPVVAGPPLPLVPNLGGSLNTLPPVTPGVQLPKVGTSGAPAKFPPTAPMVEPFPSGNPTGPSVGDITAALRSFLTGGTPGTVLSTSADPGNKPTTPLSTTSLPALSVVPNPWAVPSAQPIYDLNKFHQSYVDTDDKFVLGADGSLTSKKGGKRISSSKEWNTAAQNFGMAMSASPAEHNFDWSDFVLWTQSIDVLFGVYHFQAVVEFERAWRRWRRANGKRWAETNPVLRDLYLTGKELRGTGPSHHGQPYSPKAPGATPLCLNFSRSACTRLALCRFTHKCSRCKTTFPNTTASCPCVNGTLPPSVNLPSGVTFGQ